MKNKFITFIIVLTIFACGTTQALAVKRAIFPDSKSLQPIPNGVSPNISGNVNSTVNVSPLTQTDNQTTPTATINTTTPNIEKPGSPNLLFYILWSILIIIIISGSFIYYFKHRKID